MDPVIVASIIGAVITVLLGNWMIASKSQAKTEGKIEEALKGMKERMDRFEEDQRAQWSKLSDHTDDIGILKGKSLNGKAHGAHT